MKATFRRQFLSGFLLPVCVVGALGATTSSILAGAKPSLVIAFMIEGGEIEGPRVVQPVPLGTEKIWVRKLPLLTQKNIKAFYPFAADDGTMGVALRVDESGWRNVREAGSLDLGKRLLVMVNGRVVQTLKVDNPKKDDKIVVIWRGLTQQEVAVLRKAYPEIANTPEEKTETDKEKAKEKDKPSAAGEPPVELETRNR